MKPERFARLKKLLLAASDLPAEEWRTYLERACPDDPELQSEAESILNSDAVATGVLKQAGHHSPSALYSADETPPLPEKIGQYTIKRVIAAGGMGVVYEAEQEKPRRTVALKVMRSGIASASVLRRFEYESQLLARLTHPGIAQVYEAGTHDDGMGLVPYFAMEYVPDAKSIIEYAEEKKLGTRDRLQLFAQVCDAVHHGHQKGIIHRDLKPGNILVNPEGRVKIIDFGVARSTDSDMALTTMKTDVGQMIGTLQYMSPEQCAADPNDIDTRSDVYALGVVQYELLCGQLPYDVKQKAIHEVARVIREEQPTRPSSISRQIRGDVETITLKTLEKERDRRYQSAVELAQDIRRYLSGEAIFGRPPSMVYQLQIFARRHKAIFGALAAIFVVLAVGLAVSTGMYFRAEQAREETALERDRAVAAEQEAEKRRAEADAVTTFLSDTLAAVDPSEAQGKEVTVREMLDKAAEKIDEAFAEQPLVEATLRVTIGNTYHALGEYTAAEPHLVSALEIRKRELGEEEVETVRAMNHLARLRTAQGRGDEAATLYERSLELHRRILGDEHPHTIRVLAALSSEFYDQGRGRFGDKRRLDEAERLAEEALDLCRKHLGEEDSITLAVMTKLAELKWEQDKDDEAETLFLQALDIFLAQSEENPEVLEEVLEPLSRLTWIGPYWEHKDRLEPFYRRLYEYHRRTLGEGHPRTIEDLKGLAQAISGPDRRREAEKLREQVLALTRNTFGDEHGNTLQAMFHLASNYRGRGCYEKAEALLRRDVELRRQAAEKNDHMILDQIYHLASIHIIRGRLSEAESLMHEMLERSRHVDRFGDRYAWMAKNKMIEIYRKQGRYDEAETLILQFIDLCEQQRGKNHTLTLLYRSEIALLYQLQERYDDAEKLAVQILETAREMNGDHESGSFMVRLGWLYFVQGRYEQAETLIAEAVKHDEKGCAAFPEGGTPYLYHHGHCLLQMGRFEEAETAFLKALENQLPAERDDGHILVVTMRKALVELYDAWGKPDKAAECRAKLPTEDLQPTPD